MDKQFAHGIPSDRERTTFREFESNINEIKRLPPDQIGNMLPQYVE